MLGDRLALADTHRSDDVAVGEARVVRSGPGTTGVYRDEDGVAHGVSLRCTHLGCLLHCRRAQLGLPLPRLAV